MESAGIPCGPINTIDKVMKNRQILSRNMIVEVDDPQVGKIKIAGNPIKMTSIEEKKYRKAPPEIGEHNPEILKRFLNLSKDEIDKLIDDGVL